MPDTETTGWVAATDNAAVTSETPVATETTKQAAEGKPAEEAVKSPVQPVVTDSKEYKTLQTKLNKANEELTRLRANHASTATIEARTAKMEQILEAMVDEFGNTEEQEEGQPPTKSRLKQRYEAIKGQTEAQGKQLAEAVKHATDVMKRIQGVATKAGIDLNGPDAESARTLWNNGDIDGALEEVQEIRMRKMQTDLEAKFEAKFKKAKSDEETVDSVDTSLPGSHKSNIYTAADIAKEKRLKDPMETIRAMTEGRIKTKR
ncbi:MAG: hypothetical protein WC455_15510 [Dehalococcoidia bacterium]|jgi:hypothetical protein